MRKYYSVDGYWKDDDAEFQNYIVTNYDDDNDEDDTEIFFYGLDESDIKQAIKDGRNSALDFVITNYKPIN